MHTKMDSNVINLGEVCRKTKKKRKHIIENLNNANERNVLLKPLLKHINNSEA